MSIGRPALVDPALASFAVVLGEAPATVAAAVRVVPGTMAAVQVRRQPTSGEL